MQAISITDFGHWRNIARSAMQAGVPPEQIDLKANDGQQSLFGVFGGNESSELKPDDTTGTPISKPRISKPLLNLLEKVACHRASERWNLLYRIVWRINTTQPHLLEISTDDDVIRLMKFEKEVRRDAHKMKAFVRFRKIIRDGEEFYIAWHRPDHRIVRLVAPFFSRRFKGMNWTIMTPDESVVWDQSQLVYDKGLPRSAAPDSDELEQLWKTYYANIFNPARVKVKMMKSEMPVRYWSTLPEAEIIADLLADAPRRVEEMIKSHEGFVETAQAFIPQPSEPPSLSVLRESAAACKACDLYLDATQVVFGSGPQDARIVILGEQPGDQEDLAGKPFVGPAGQVLNRALAAAGIDRDTVYLTNIVKHFKHQVTTSPDQRKGKRRLHQKPNAREVRCCRPWFDAEWANLSDAVVLVCLGATAANAIITPGFKITSQRGQWHSTDYCERTIASWHPSAILRSADADSSEQRFQQLVTDLNLARTSC